MADVTKFYVMKGDKTLAEGMTKEEVYAAIVQAIEQGEISDVDTGFVTTLKEMNSGAGFKCWLGTEAQYQAMPEHENNVLYLITDDTTAEDLEEFLQGINADVEAMKTDIAYLKNAVAFLLPDGYKTIEAGKYYPIATGSQHPEAYVEAGTRITIKGFNKQGNGTAVVFCIPDGTSISVLSNTLPDNIAVNTWQSGGDNYYNIVNNGDDVLTFTVAEGN